MHEDRVARLSTAFPHDAPITEAGSVVRLQQAGEAGFLSWSLVIGRIDMQRAALPRSLRLGSRFYAHGVADLSRRPVRILQLESAFVLRPRLQIEDAAGEAVGHDVVEVLARSKDLFSTNADERERLAPGGFAGRAELHVNRRVAVRVAADRPFEAEVHQRGVLDHELAGLGAVLGGRRNAGQHETGHEA